MSLRSTLLAMLTIFISTAVPSLVSAQEKSKAGTTTHCPAEGWVTCEQWCEIWRGGSSMCKFTHEKSCMKLYGSLKSCVRNLPPRTKN